jgi:hypothetical protein
VVRLLAISLWTSDTRLNRQCHKLDDLPVFIHAGEKKILCFVAISDQSADMLATAMLAGDRLAI